MNQTIISSNCIKKFKIQINLIIFLILIFQMGSCAKESNLHTGKIPSVQPPIDGLRIALAFRIITKIAPQDSRAGYFGYARMVQLFDGRLARVYEKLSGNIELVFSTDLEQVATNLQLKYLAKHIPHKPF